MRTLHQPRGWIGVGVHVPLDTSGPAFLLLSGALRALLTSAEPRSRGNRPTEEVGGTILPVAEAIRGGSQPVPWLCKKILTASLWNLNHDWLQQEIASTLGPESSLSNRSPPSY